MNIQEISAVNMAYGRNKQQNFGTTSLVGSKNFAKSLLDNNILDAKQTEILIKNLEKRIPKIHSPKGYDAKVILGDLVQESFTIGKKLKLTFITTFFNLTSEIENENNLCEAKKIISIEPYSKGRKIVSSIIKAVKECFKVQCKAEKEAIARENLVENFGL